MKKDKTPIRDFITNLNQEVKMVSSNQFLFVFIFAIAFLFFFSSVLIGELALLVAGWVIFCIKTEGKIKELFLNINKHEFLLTFTTTMSVIIMFESEFVGGLLLLLLIWGYNSKSIPHLIERFKRFKQHKIRIVLSIIIILISTTMAFLQFKETKQRMFIENYPVPIITIISDQNKQGNLKQYELEFSVKEYLNVKVNNKKISPVSDLFKKTIDLNTPITKILIEAENEYKSSQKKISITRDETQEEKQKRVEKENENERLAEERRIREKFERESQDGDVASVCAQTYIKNHLNSPSSAKFPWSFGSVTPLGENSYFVINYVDAQNLFGAMIRTNYQCMVYVIDADNFICESTCEM
ncbi:MAG: hypothetical protein KAR54_02335 [Candidatus Pacebacteria bacterium]|nr:hypothetical protein [Candidatus Paceibacterota bacterium]